MAVQLLAEQYFIARNRNGQPVNGACAYFFLTETSTRANVFADADLTTPLEQPVVADSAGRFVPVYLDPTVKYRMRVYDGNPTAEVNPGVEIEPSPYDPLTNFYDFANPNAAPLVEGWVTAVSDPTTPITVGPGKRNWRMPYPFLVTEVRASLATAQTSGDIITFDILKSGASMLTTAITIDNGETTSVSALAQPEILDPNIDDDEALRFDVTQVGDGTAIEAHVTLIGHRT